MTKYTILMEFRKVMAHTNQWRALNAKPAKIGKMNPQRGGRFTTAVEDAVGLLEPPSVIVLLPVEAAVPVEEAVPVVLAAPVVDANSVLLIVCDGAVFPLGLGSVVVVLQGS